MRISTKKLKALIKEENMASKEYKSYGLHGIAKQEKSHAVILSKILRGRK